MTTEEQLLKSLNELIEIFKGEAQRQQNASSTRVTSNGFNDSYSSERISEYEQKIREINRETGEIRENIFGYETVLKRVNRLEKEKKKLLDDIKSGEYQGVALKRKELELAHKLNEIERERAKLQIDGYTKLDENYEKWQKRTNAFKKGIGEIKQGFNDVIKSVKTVTES